MVAVFEFVSAKEMIELKDDRFGADVLEVTRHCRKLQQERQREIEDRMILRQLIGSKREELLAILHDKNTKHNPSLAIIDTVKQEQTSVPQLTLVEEEPPEPEPEPATAPKKRKQRAPKI